MVVGLGRQGHMHFKQTFFGTSITLVQMPQEKFFIVNQWINNQLLCKLIIYFSFAEEYKSEFDLVTKMTPLKTL